MICIRLFNFNSPCDKSIPQINLGTTLVVKYDMSKNLNLKLCRHHVHFEALLINQPPKYSHPKEHAVGTAVILDFLERINIINTILITQNLFNGFFPQSFFKFCSLKVENKLGLTRQ